MAASGDTARPSASAKPGQLRARILSALVLAPVALGAVWYGPPLLSALVVVAAMLMAWEWARLCGAGRIRLSGAASIAASAAAVLLAAFGLWSAALIVLVVGAALVLAIGRLGRESGAALAMLGCLWIGLPCVAFLWLAEDPATGRGTIFWILAVVWATDIGAYAAGRTIGGPRLAPRASPSKTWSGLAGGVLAAAIAGTLAAALANGNGISLAIASTSAALAVVAQFGDLAESLAKRHFGVKDSSGLIPGHGGLLDRLDGLLAVIPVVAFLSLVGGSSVVTWR